MSDPYNANPSEALYFAVRADEKDVVDTLKTHDAEPSEALYFAIKAGDEGVTNALQKDPYNANLSDAKKYAVNGVLDKITTLIQKNDDKKKDKATQLYEALKDGNQSNLNKKDKKQFAPKALYYAIKAGDEGKNAATALMRDPYNADPSEALYFAVRAGEKAVVDALIKTHDADPSEALYFAVRDDKSELANSLKTNHKADSSKALYYAVRDDDTITANTLTKLPYKADPSKTLYWAIYFECQENPEANCQDIIAEYSTYYYAKLSDTKEFAVKRGLPEGDKIISIINEAISPQQESSPDEIDNAKAQASNTIQNVARGYQARILVERLAKAKQSVGGGSMQK
jgi:hypothetical protein